MTKRKNVFQIVVIGAAAIVFFVPSVGAQGKRNLIVDDQPRPVAPRRPRPIAKADNRVEIRYKPGPTTIIRVSSLAVTTEPGAEVLLLSAARTKPYRKVLIADREGTVLFDPVDPGNYKLEVSKDGFETLEADKVTVGRQQPLGKKMDLKPITYKLKVATNLTGGDIRFARAIYKGKDANGYIISEPLGNYCVVKIKKNGEAEIADLIKGYYDIDIRPDSVEFDNQFAGVEVPYASAEADLPASGDLKPIRINLPKNISRDSFGTSWIPADWVMPSSWRLERGLKVRNAEGIALPQNPRYRYYVNFELIANVKLRDQGTVGFVLRAEDDKNYYLLQISGERGEEPNTAALYEVINGRRKYLNSAPAVAFTKTLASENGFRIFILGDELGFTVSVEDSDTGKTFPLGRLPDQYKTFRKGAMGIAALPKSNFEVNYFEVCTPTCPK